LDLDQIESMQVRTVMDNPEELAAIALLMDPVRWRLYDYLRSSRGPVGRNEAARAANVSRNLASFHLDRMAEANLLEVPQHQGATRGRLGHQLLGQPGLADPGLAGQRHHPAAAGDGGIQVGGEYGKFARTADERCRDQAHGALHRATHRRHSEA
jgi:hypothetical protein